MNQVADYPAAAASTVQRKAQLDWVSRYVLYALVVTGPIYWIPGVPTGLFSIAKDLLLLIFVVTPVIAFMNKGVLFPRFAGYKSTVIWLIALIVAAMPGMLLALDLNASLLTYIRFLVVLPLFIQVTRVYQIQPELMETSFKLMAVPIVISCLFVLMAMGGFLAFRPPDQFIVSYGTQAYMMGLSFRTGGLSWSASYVAPIMAYFWLKSESRTQRFLWLAGLVITVVVASFLSNRGGFLVMLVAVFGVVITLVATTKSLWKYLLLGGVIYVALTFGTSFISDLLVRDSEEYRQLADISLTYSGLNELTTGRWERYADAVEIIARNAAVGIGFGQDIVVDYAIWTSQFHNLFLAHAVATGVFSGMLLLGFFAFIGWIMLLKFNRLVRTRRDQFMIVPIMMLLPHFANTLIESGHMFSNVTQGIPFWFALGALIMSPVHERLKHQKESQRAVEQEPYQMEEPAPAKG